MTALNLDHLMLHGLKRDAPAFLASVTSASEAAIALGHGADVIDAKDPARGALGALSVDRIEAIVAAVAGRAPVSATIGDLPSDPAVMVSAAEVIAAAGVNVVKAGFFGAGPHEAAIAALGRAHLGKARLAGVLMADLDPDFGLIAAMARAGFAIVMLDTAAKGTGGLRAALCEVALIEFLGAARSHGLSAGLAGSLSQSDILALVRLSPDFLGFRGALCAGARTSDLQPSRVAAVASAIAAAALKATNSGRPGEIERSVA